MISLDAIDQTILELEAKDTTFANCERLAPLYIVRDHLRKYTESQETAQISAESDFLHAVMKKPMQKIWPVIDELVQDVKMLHPKMYEAFMAKINEL